MTRNTSLFLSFALLLLLTACGSNKVEKEPALSLIWEMGKNQIEPGIYENTFYVVNTSKEQLDSDWVVYFGQVPRTVITDSLAPITIEQLKPTFFRMRPSKLYQPIAKGDTLKLVFRCKGSMIKETNGPEGAYWVRIDKEGKESVPENISIKKLPFNQEDQWSRAGAAELPYPYGDVVYDQNSMYITDTLLSPTDIFPSIKSVVNKGGMSLFTENIQIKYDNDAAENATLLTDRLELRYGCDVKNTGETKIELKLAPAPKHLSDNKEYYTIDIQDNTFIITGASTHGIFNGCETLIRILGSNKLPYKLPNVHIEDYPDLDYRGLMLDVARNFTRKPYLIKLIDIMASFKLNDLHLHLTDDEGWRIEIKGLEELTSVGGRRGHTLNENEFLYPAYGSGWDPKAPNSIGSGYYSRADFIEILKYAQKRHIRVIPEIDVPGHARAAIKAMDARYNKYAATDKAKAEEYLLRDVADTSKYVSAQAFTDNVINVAMPSTYRFVEKVVDEMQSIYKEAGLELNIIHLGGDEVPHGAWEGSPTAIAFMKEKQMKETRELKDYFIEQCLAILKKRNIQMAGWQEATTLTNGTVNTRFADKNILSYCWNTIPEWKGDEIPYRLANSGCPVILSSVSNFYFDLAYNKHQLEPGLYWAGFVNEYNSFDMLPYNIYKSVRRDLRGNPIDIQKASKEKLPLQKNASKNIVGVQGQLFAETIRDFDMVEYYLFPKMYGLIERGWNARPAWGDTDNDTEYWKAVKYYNKKIADVGLSRLAWLNVNFRLSQPGIKKIDGKIYMNCTVSGAKIHYTTDGSEPTASSPQWTEPLVSDAKVWKAKAFFKQRQSMTTLYSTDRQESTTRAK